MIKPLSKDRITFRYISIPHGDVTIGGIGLWYQSELDAKADFEYFKKYILTPSKLTKHFQVTFKRDSPKTHCLKVDISYPEAFYRISITKIESEYVVRLCESLATLPFFLIIAGYIDEKGELKMLPLSEYNFLVSRLSVDGRHVEGNKDKPWPSDIFQTGPAHVIEEPLTDFNMVN